MLVDPITEAQCVAFVCAESAAGRGGRVATINVDYLGHIARHPDFAAFCRNADLVVADGMPLVWASRLQGAPLPERVTGSDLVWSLSGGAAAAGRSVFFAGGEPGAAEGAARALRQHLPSLSIAGTACPAFEGSGNRAALDDLSAVLAAARPDIVFVGLPALKTQLLIANCAPRFPGAWWIGVGAAFSFAAGLMPRAPRWQQRLGLEWLHRLALEPARLAPRYLGRDAPAVLGLLAGSAWRRLRRNAVR